MDRKKAAATIVKQKNKIASLEQELNSAINKLASFEKRAQAEDVLIRANETEGAPERLQTVTVDEFLGKRAQLEDREDGYIDKAAALVEFSSGGDDFILSDMPAGDASPADLTGWLRQNAH